MACCGVCCRKPRYKRLIDSLFPEDAQNDHPVQANVDKVIYFAHSTPEDLNRMGQYLYERLRKSLHRGRLGHTCVALKITERLLSDSEQRHIQLIAGSYLDMLHIMLDSTHSRMRIMATKSFVTFADREEGITPYHRQYDSFIHHFASLSLCANQNDLDLYQQMRLAGLRGLRGVVKKIGHQEGLQLNIWDIDQMNKIVPPFLFNMQDSSEVNELAEYAGDGLKQLVVCAGLAHIDSVLVSVLQHFDLNNLWTQNKTFSVGIFVTFIETMQKQDCYKVIQALVRHLDNKAKESCTIKQGILDALSQCVIVASDGSLGPSVLDVFRTLVKHLRISIEGPVGYSEGSQPSLSEDSHEFQKSITKTVGEFAGALPDYHKPDIMQLINSYMVHTGVSGASEERVSHQGYQLSASLVQCLKAVASTYHPAILETTFPDSLFTSLVQLFDIRHPDIQLDVLVLWHQLIDHHNNSDRIPFHIGWQSLESEGLLLGKVSASFLKQNGPVLYRCLAQLAEHLYSNQKNLRAFYKLLFLMSLEFSQAGVLELVLFLNQLQSLAVKKPATMGDKVCVALHGIVAGLLYLVSKVTTAPALQEHIEQVLMQRKTSSPFLLPSVVLGSQDGLDGTAGADACSMDVQEHFLFSLDEGLLRTSPEVEPKRSFGRFGRDNSTGPDLKSHFSVSLDYGSDTALPVEQISFNSFKEKMEQVVVGDDIEIHGISDPSEPGPTSISYQEAVGKASTSEKLDKFNLAEILKSAVTPVPPEQERNSSAYDMDLPSLH